jgi:hypothetical protein
MNLANTTLIMILSILLYMFVDVVVPKWALGSFFFLTFEKRESVIRCPGIYARRSRFFFRQEEGGRDKVADWH